ncbi:MAG: hypothetical protein DMF63_05875 [Acidobacteria bacterium]|nr:MAG: hypothetical protein DMF63_05875 [Acidobacteriota bacterium]
MKKFIQISALLSLLVLFNVAASVGQSNFGTDVNIPFAFNVGDQSYEAGDYILKFERFSAGSATLTIQDVKNEKSQTVLMNAGGDMSRGEIKLVFDTLEGQRYLTKVKTPSRTFAIIMNKPDKKKSGQDASGSSAF